MFQWATYRIRYLLINMSNKRLDPNCFELLFNFQSLIFFHIQENGTKICII